MQEIQNATKELRCINPSFNITSSKDLQNLAFVDASQVE